MNILITSIGSNTAIGVAKSLKKHGFVLHGTDINPRFYCPGTSFVDIFHQIPHANSNKYEDTLLELISSNDIKCVIPIHDLEVKKISKLSFSMPSITKWAVPDRKTIDICSNKKIANKRLNNVAYIPKVFNSIGELQYPFICKPLEGVSSRGISICTQEEYNKAKLNLKDDYIYQEYIKGQEFTVDCYSSYKDKDFFICSVRKRIETKAGLSIKGQIVKNELIEMQCKLIHQELEYKGVSNIQFIISEKDQKPYFIEINPRFAGGGVLTYLNGLNIPLMTVSELLKLEDVFPINQQKPRLNIHMVRFYEESFFDGEGNLV